MLFRSAATIKDAYNALGLGKLYRLGLTELMALRSKARKISLEAAEKIRDSNQAAFSAVACAREAFPVMPLFLNDDGTVVDEGGSLPAGTKPIGTLQAVATVSALIGQVS